MNRREFFRRSIALLATTAISELDLDRLLWVPGARTIFLPTQTIFILDTHIVNEALARLIGNLTLAQYVNRKYANATYGGKLLQITPPKVGGV